MMGMRIFVLGIRFLTITQKLNAENHINFINYFTEIPVLRELMRENQHSFTATYVLIHEKNQFTKIHTAALMMDMGHRNAV